MKDVYVFAIETSCDETSASIVKNGKEEIATVVLSQIDIHKNFGGVVPEIASRNHTGAITMVFEECLKKANMTFNDIDAIAVTYGPGLNGALLIGIEAAKALSFATGKPLIPVNHMAGHIYANKFVGEFKFPLLCLVVSGGHTEIVYMDKEYSFKRIGSTLDDSVGEAYDKVARVVGIPYPGGPLMDKLASKGKHSYNLPAPKDDNSYDFSFSGIKSAVINLVHNEKQRGNEINKEDLATSFQETAIGILVKKTKRALEEYGVKQLLLAGGVSANSGLRKALEDVCKNMGVELLKPEIKYCTDNAAMIGAAAYYAYLKGDRADFSLNPEPGLDL
ncbi:MAG: tRNA (adenosine(37)-N6)-threonylcarbamoyltransferase complex transferase subunit TsaD [Candidatus Aphodocola sp.]